ncbi:rhodanese-like domain-containing protein [Alsobacter sp. R-9]
MAVSGAMPDVENLGIDDIRSGLANGSILLVDVREPNEWEAGHIPGSVLMPLSVFDPHEIPPANGRRIVLSCRSGKRSLTAAGIAHEAGIPIDAHYAGGFLDWVSHGAPVETGS